MTLYLIIGTAINVAGGRSGCLEMLPQYNILSWREFLASVVVSYFLRVRVLFILRWHFLLLLLLQERITFGQCSRNADHAPFTNFDKPRH